MSWTTSSRSSRKDVSSTFDRPLVVSLRQTGFDAKLSGSRSERVAKRRAKLHGMRSESDFDVPGVGKNDLDTSATSDARLIEKRVNAMDEDQTLTRYHELVDLRLMSPLDYKEVFELDLIEARLNAADIPDLKSVQTLENSWVQQQEKLIDSVQTLLSRLTAR